MEKEKMVGGKPGNKNALKWTGNKLEKLCNKLLKIAKDEKKKRWTLKQIAYEAGSTYKIVKHLGDFYQIVSDTIDEIQAILQARWLAPALTGTGHGAIVKQFLNYHSQEITDFEDNRCLKQAERIENIKTDGKIRTKEAFIEVLEKEDSITPKMALLINEYANKKAQELFEKGKS